MNSLSFYLYMHAAELLVQMLFANPDILLLDEPTNHADMESIKSLNNPLEKYKGTRVFVSHGRELVSSLVTCIIEIKTDGSSVDSRGNCEAYLSSQGVE